MDQISFEKTTLSNGLDVIFHEDHSLPLVTVNVWYHVGSKDEEPGKTGYAHLFEHLMFEGSKNHNSSFFEPLVEVGATLNGSTNTDRTNYWENLPSNYLELALWLESDRMGFLLDALDQKRFDIQRDVVKNERRQSYENRPYGMAGLRIQEALYPHPHPYHWPTIGYHEDLDVAKLEDAHAFFQRFYTPSNASLAIAGDFDLAQTTELVERYFGDLLPGAGLRRINRTDSPLQGQVQLTLYDQVLVPRLFLGWPTVPRFHQDEAPLAILADILGNGKTSRLHRTLVYDRRIAQNVGVSHDGQEVAGDFGIDITAAEGHATSEIEEVVRGELDQIRTRPPTDGEVARSKNRVEWYHVRQMANIGGFGGRANRLNSFNVYAGDPDLINSDMQRYLAVEPEDIRRVAETYLGDQQVQLVVLPEPTRSHSTAPTDRASKPVPTLSTRFQPPIPQRHVMSNGMQLLVMEKQEIPMVAFGVVLKTGAANDPNKLPGLASFTSAMIQEGTTSRSSEGIADEFEFFGSQLQVSTGREYTVVGTESLAREFPRAIELVSDVLLHPTFPNEELSRVGKERLTAVRRRRDDPTAMADLLMPALLYGRESALGHPASGTAELFDMVVRDDLVNHYGAAYGPQVATLAVVGDISADEVLKLAEQHLGPWQAVNPTEAQGAADPVISNGNPSKLYLLDKSGAAQSVIRTGSFGVPRSHPDYFAHVLFNHLFGGQFTSRLNKNLRQDKGYSYGYRSWFEWHRQSSLFMAGGGVQTEVTKEALQETLREFEEIKSSRPVSDEEFHIARDGLLRQFPSSFESCGQILQQLAQIVWHDLPDDYYRSFSENLEAVTLSDVQRVAEERVKEQPLIMVVGDRANIEEGLTTFGLPIQLVDYDGRPV